MGLSESLKDYPKKEVDAYITYLRGLRDKKKWDDRSKSYVSANPWVAKKTDEFFVDCFKKIQATGLAFDGVHIIIQERGVGYDYVAYKNKMLLAYPESKLDVGLVYKGDEFIVKKDSGHVEYSHNIKDPFGHKDEDIVGGYVVIKNKRGEFFTSLSLEEINKCKAVAKTDTIWKMWFPDMCQKTVIKKAVKLHFDDIFKEIEQEDNKNYDLDKPLEEEKKDDALEYFKNEVKDLPNKDELIAQFETADVPTRRQMYRDVLEQRKAK